MVCSVAGFDHVSERRNVDINLLLGDEALKKNVSSTTVFVVGSLLLRSCRKSLILGHQSLDSVLMAALSQSLLMPHFAVDEVDVIGET